MKYSLKTLVIPFVLILLGLFFYTSAPDRLSDNSLNSLKTKLVAPEFVLPDINGKLYALSDYRGKIVVVNFWASWCPPCVAEMPSLQKAADQLAPHNISVLGIGVGESRESVRRFLRSTPVHFPLLLDSGSDVMDKWAAPSLPTTIVINQEGKMALLALGERDWGDAKILQQIISLQQTP